MLTSPKQKLVTFIIASGDGVVIWRASHRQWRDAGYVFRVQYDEALPQKRATGRNVAVGEFFGSAASKKVNDVLSRPAKGCQQCAVVAVSFACR
jgi:hypothetical protein